MIFWLTLCTIELRKWPFQKHQFSAPNMPKSAEGAHAKPCRSNFTLRVLRHPFCIILAQKAIFGYGAVYHLSGGQSSCLTSLTSEHLFWTYFYLWASVLSPGITDIFLGVLGSRNPKIRFVFVRTNPIYEF